MITIDISKIEKIIKNLRLKYIFIFILISLIFPGACTFITICTQELDKNEIISIFLLYFMFYFIVFLLLFGISIILIISQKYSIDVKWNIIKILLEAYSDKIKVEEYSSEPKGLFRDVQFDIYRANIYGSRMKSAYGIHGELGEDFYIHLSRGFIDVFMCELGYLLRSKKILLSTIQFQDYKRIEFDEDKRLIGLKIVSNNPKYSINSLNLDQVLPEGSRYKVVNEELYVIVPLKYQGDFNIFTRTNYKNFMDETAKIFDLILDLKFPNM